MVPPATCSSSGAFSTRRLSLDRLSFFAAIGLSSCFCMVRPPFPTAPGKGQAHPESLLAPAAPVEGCTGRKRKAGAGRRAAPDPVGEGAGGGAGQRRIADGGRRGCIADWCKECARRVTA